MSTIVYWICTPFAWLVRLFYNLTGSYGVSLILFTLVIKLILLPFQMKSKRSMVRMSRMSGKMQEIQKKYANNQLKMQEEMQKFYQEEGFNPMSGCLWSFLPLPILMALYYIIREPIVYFMNFGGRAAGLEVVEAARQVIENAGITLTSNPAYEQIEISQIINSQFPDFVAQHSGWVNVNYHFLGVDLNSLQRLWDAQRRHHLERHRSAADSHHFRCHAVCDDEDQHEGPVQQLRCCHKQEHDADDAPVLFVDRFHAARRPGCVLDFPERVLRHSGVLHGQVL